MNASVSCYLQQRRLPSLFQLHNFRKRARLTLRIAVQALAQTLQSGWRELVFTHDQGCYLPEGAAVYL